MRLNPFKNIRLSTQLFALVAVSLWCWGVGLLLAGPVLGFASWHAYRAAVEPVPPAEGLAATSV